MYGCSAGSYWAHYISPGLKVSLSVIRCRRLHTVMGRRAFGFEAKFQGSPFQLLACLPTPATGRKEIMQSPPDLVSRKSRWVEPFARASLIPTNNVILMICDAHSAPFFGTCSLVRGLQGLCQLCMSQNVRPLS